MAEQGCCRCCCSLITTLGLSALFMWLSFRTSNPKCSIQDFYLPSLNKTLDTPQNTTLFFALRLDNPNKDKGIYYDDINLSFYYKTNGTVHLGNSTIPRFYQGHHKKATKRGNVSTHGLVDPESAFRVVSTNGSVDFRVDLDTKVRFKIMAWKTKRQSIKVSGDIQVNDQGKLQSKKGKGVKLKSSATKDTTSYCVFMGFFFNFLVLILLN